MGQQTFPFQENDDLLEFPKINNSLKGANNHMLYFTPPTFH